MAGVQVYAVDNSPSIVSDYTVRLSNTAVNGATQVPTGVNSVTRLGVVFPEEAVLLGAWWKPDAVPGTTACNLTLVQSGSFRSLGSGQGGDFQAAALHSGAVTAASRVTQTVNVGLGGVAVVNVLESIPVHPAAGGNLNNNVIPPGGELFAHIGEDPTSLTMGTMAGTLIVRVMTKGR